MACSLAGKVVVVTGASSGIGRETARALARRGATVVCAARRLEALEELAEECRALGGEAMAVATDVSDRSQVEALARRAFVRYGHIDAWVNDAGVYLIGELVETPDADIKRLLDTNLLGCMWGAKVVIPYFERQGHGHIVNVSSVFGKVAGPYVSAYVASKYGVRGLSDSLRQELAEKGIDVTCVFPPAVDTPLWDHAANYAGEVAKPIKPVYSPRKIGEAIAKAVVRPKREVWFGPGFLFSVARVLMPGVFERVNIRQTKAQHFMRKAQAPTSGNIHRPIAKGQGAKSELLKPKRRARKAFLAAAFVLPAAYGLRQLAARA